MIRALNVLALLLLPAFAFAQFGAGPKLDVKAAPELDGAATGSVLRVALSATLESGWHVNSHEPLEEFLIPTEFSLKEDPRWKLQRAVYPPSETVRLSFSDKPVAVYEGTFAIGAMIELTGAAAPGPLQIEGSLRYQACNDKQCAPPKTIPVSIAVNVLPTGQNGKSVAGDAFKAIKWDAAAGAGAPTPPASKGAPATTAVQTAEPGAWRALADRFEVVGRLPGYADGPSFIAFVDAAESGKGGAISQNYLADKGLIWMLLLVLLGGFLLNLTPCVLPLIPINIAIIGAGARAGSKQRGFMLGAAYGAGIALVYGALGLLVVVGVSSAFGTLNSNPWFVGGMALFFVVLALAMFDIIHIDFSSLQAKFGLRKNENGSFLIAFAMGALSALLAGACVAPVVIAVILETQTRYAAGNPLALALPFLLGLGMALPWPFAGAGLSFLPKPGVWMNRVKYAFGVFILGLAAWYGYESYGIFSAKHAAREAAAEQGWETSLEAALKKASDEKKPVLIDFWATWCKNCLVMDATTFKDPAVLKRLDGYVKLKYQAEDVEASPAKEAMQYYQALGLPTYIVLKPK